MGRVHCVHNQLDLLSNNRFVLICNSCHFVDKSYSWLFQPHCLLIIWILCDIWSNHSITILSVGVLTCLDLRYSWFFSTPIRGWAPHRHKRTVVDRTSLHFYFCVHNYFIRLSPNLSWVVLLLIFSTPI